MTDPSSRRPIASRDSGLARRVAKYLAGTWITPNQISIASVGFAGIAGAAFWMSGQSEGFARAGWLILAALGCQFRLLCNLFDGMVAIEGGKSAPDGPFWNEAPDRFADIAIFVGLGLGAGFAALGWAAAAMAVLTAYIREIGQAQGMDADFSGPMAKPQRMAVATGVAVIAITVPSAGGIGLLEIALWIVALGAFFTSMRRSARLVKWLRSARPGHP